MPSLDAKTPKKARSFRLTAPRALESALQSQIIDWLRVEQAQRRVIWFCRVNGGLARYGSFKVWNYLLYLLGAEPTGKGYSDLHGMLAGGRYFALEVKRPGETPTPEQQQFLDAVRQGGGIAAVVVGFEEVARVLRPAATKNPRVGMEPLVAGSCAGDEPAITTQPVSKSL